MNMEKIISCMGGEVFLSITVQNSLNENKVMDELEEMLFTLIRVFNFFDEHSLLSQLNQFRRVSYQYDLAFLLKESLRFATYSENRFNVFIGKDIAERKQGLIRNIPFKDVDSSFLLFDKDSINLNKSDVLIDLGGIAKGYIIDRMKDLILERYGSKIIDLFFDARGDCVFYGKHVKRIGVENPFDEFAFDELCFKSGAVITSGHNRQKFAGGSHIIGNETDIYTITLASKTKKCYELDALGTDLIQLSSEKVLEKVETDAYLEDVECLLVLKNGYFVQSSFFSVFKK